MVKVTVHDGKLIIQLLHDSPVTLEERLKDVTAENLHDEVDTGPAVGREVW